MGSSVSTRLSSRAVLSVPLVAALTVLSCGDGEQVPIREAEVPESEYFAGDAEGYPRPSPVTIVPVADEIPLTANGRDRPGDSTESEAGTQAASNEAVELRIAASEMRTEVQGRVLANDRALLLVDVVAVNVHAKQEVERSRLEGKQDRTLGSGGLLRGGGGGQEEMVQVDVAYKIPRLADHFFIVADGIAYPLFEPASDRDGIAAPDSELVIEKQGEGEELRLAATVPRRASHLALQLLDYANGHVTAPIRGQTTRALGDDRLPEDSLAEVATSQLEIAARAFDLRDEYGDRLAPAGRQFAVIELVGRSRSASSGMGNIVQLDPTRNLWMLFDQGYLSYSEPLAGAAGRMIRFPPELPMLQEVAFLVADTAENLTLGIRVENEVVELQLAGRPPRLPSASGRHVDGEVMEVLLFGSRMSGDRVVVDLGLRSLLDGQGLEIQPAAQFLLRAGELEVGPDRTAAGALSHPPPEPFIVPPGVSVRFELAYTTASMPSAVRVRGFRSDGMIELRP